MPFLEPYHVTEDEIIEVGRRWDPRPYHTDPQTASKSIFGGVVTCSNELVFQAEVSLLVTKRPK